MRETVKQQNNSKNPQINFIPSTEEEKKHIEKLESLLEKKRRGDWGLVAELIEVTPATAEKSFVRVYSKHHFKAVEALEKVITDRHNLLNNKS